MSYIHQDADWPHFRLDHTAVQPALGAVRYRQGVLLGRMQSLGLGAQDEAALSALTQDVVTSSEIEGEHLNPDEVRSSIARQLGLEAGGLAPADRHVEGVVQMVLDATQNYDEPLTQERLFSWHGALFPTGRSGLHEIITGCWRDGRDGPMRVVSGRVGRERIHFEAPDAARVPDEMARFLDWLNRPAENDAVIQSALAHLWFVTIHPFDDGNGRIARAIADYCLARAERSGHRFYSMSSQIRARRNVYYSTLEHTQKDGLDVTAWLLWFLDCLDAALGASELALLKVNRRAHFWHRHADVALNARQRKIITRLLEDFDSKLTSSKWAALAKCSQDTAARDLAALLEAKVLVRGAGGGRSTHYVLADDASASP